MTEENSYKWNNPTTLTNYLGQNPQYQSKSNGFGYYRGPSPAYHMIEETDYQLPVNSVMNNPGITPRYEIAAYNIPKSGFSASELRGYRDELNPKGAAQVEFKAHELYGYGEHLT